MKSEVISEKDIASVIAPLTEDNKRYVIAVAHALLYTQKRRKKDKNCQTLSEYTS